MTQTAEAFNNVSNLFGQDNVSTSGKSGSTKMAEHLEFLMLLEMFRDKPQVQKMLDAIDRKGKCRLKKGKFASAAFLKAVIYGRLYDIQVKEESNKPRAQSGGWSVMQNAAYYNRIEMLLKQIKMGKRLDQRNADGMTAFDMAKARGNMSILELLSTAQNFITLLEKNKYNESKDPTRSHFLSKEYIEMQNRGVQ